MKCVMAIIRIDKMNETKRALRDAGITSMTASGKVFGRGKGLWDAKVIEGAKNDTPEALELLGKEPRLRPQRVIQIIIPNNKVEACVETIIEANQTPSPGDGKIFVLPVSESIRVRTGERGDSVLDI
ncbi:P-II family nitrogen regulator [Carboxylicivirga caseinilyticus]|uniref:P-II family nitrogen regulator n=1 Tax=Carboxylicivirga caseinilyticus TaxID=3417572 RepID=UPI003D32CF4A|nr:P-II family nitrogen regulator [Marinilabiliaceae bacterium A049]